jgi:hypothetical protein
MRGAPGGSHSRRDSTASEYCQRVGKASRRKTLRKQGIGPSRAELQRRRQAVPARSAGLAEDLALSELIDHTADLKGELCRYVERPPFRDAVEQELRDGLPPDVAGNPALMTRIIDDFIFGYRFSDGSTVIDSFLQQRHGLSAADREVLLAWRHPVEGVFEVQRKERDSVVLLSLLDDLEYRTYCNLGRAYFAPLGTGWFLECRLVPVGDVWVISGAASVERPERGGEMARRARAELEADSAIAFRNPVLAEVGWARQRELRTRFIEFFGTDEVLLTASEAAERIKECFGSTQDVGFRLPCAADQDSTVGLIFDERDGLMCCANFGVLRDLFADPSLAADPAHAEALASYLGSDPITPTPLERLAGAHPEHADQVFRTVLEWPDFCWEEHGEGLLRERKPWYYAVTEPQPSALVLSARLAELLNAG